jgi:hypothetical protein
MRAPAPCEEIVMHIDLEQARRRAKELLREARSGDAVLRADRAPRLADAQHAVAQELGFRSWAALTGAARAERVVEPGPEYVPGAPVRVRIRRREHRYDIHDDGEAVRRAGAPPGWLDAARRTVDAHALNVNRAGVVFVQAVEGRDIDELARRIADASAAVHDALLELQT